MTQDSFQTTTVLSRTWTTVEKMVTSEENIVPDFRGYGQDREVFEKLAHVCFQSVLPRKKWMSNFDKKVLSEYMTIADEALAYLILENNLVDWLMIAKKQVEDVKKRKKETKYTLVTVSGGTKSSGGFRKGWSYEGKLRYNQYYDLITEKRKVRGVKEMEEEVLNTWKKEEEEVNRDKDVAEEPPAKKPRFIPRSGFIVEL